MGTSPAFQPQSSSSKLRCYRLKPGACPEDCKYCPQSGHYNTGLDKEKLLEVEKVVTEARAARKRALAVLYGGRSGDLPQRICLRDGQVKSLVWKTCMTLGCSVVIQAGKKAFRCRTGLLQP